MATPATASKNQPALPLNERGKCSDPCTLLKGHPGRCLTERGIWLKR